MRLAVIDIGSNTIKVTVFDAARTLNEVYSRSISAKLSAHTVDGVLSENGIRTLCLAVNELKRTARRFFCKKQRIFAFATACVRGAKNRDEILRIAEKVTRMKINLLSGEEEAELCFLGALASSGCPRSGVLADLGGGSCEFIRFEDRMATDRVSLNIGALSTYKKFASQRFLSKSETEELRLFVNRELEPYRARITLPSGGVFAVTGGSAKAAVKILSLIEKRTAVLPFTVSVCDAKKLCDGATSGELTELLCKNIGDRAEALTSAITILTCSAEMLGVSSFTVIGGGARIGLATKLTNADDQENLWTR